MNSSIKNWTNKVKGQEILAFFLPFLSICVSVDESLYYREEQDFDVQHDGPVFDVIQIAVDAQPDRSITAVAIYLRPSRDAGTDLVLDHVTGDLFFKLLYEKWALRPGADEAHLAFQHVKQLGQLVHTRFADEFADRSDAWVVGCRPRFFLIGSFLNCHRAEFIHHKWFAVEADALLLKDERAFRGCLNDDRHDEHWD